MLEGCDTMKVISAIKASPYSPMTLPQRLAHVLVRGDLKVPPTTFTPRLESISTNELEAPNKI
jgi:hypothetical protein